MARNKFSPIGVNRPKTDEERKDMRKRIAHNQTIVAEQVNLSTVSDPLPEDWVNDTPETTKTKEPDSVSECKKPASKPLVGREKRPAL